MIINILLIVSLLFSPYIYSAARIEDITEARELSEFWFLEIKGGDLQNIRLLLANKVDINKQDEEGNTAAHIAVKNRNKEILLFLISNKANLDLKNNGNETPKDLANKLGYKDILKIFLKLDKVAVVKEKVEEKTAKKIKESKKNNKVGRPKKKISVKTKSVTKSTKLGKNKKMVDKISVVTIVENKPFEKSSPSKKIQNNIHQPIKQQVFECDDCNKKFISNEALIKHRGNQHSDLWFNAIELNEIDTLILLKDLYHIDLKNSKGMTSLHVAVLNNNLEIAKFLLSNYDSALIKNDEGETPQELAIKLGDPAMIELLTKSIYAEAPDINDSLRFD